MDKLTIISGCLFLAADIFAIASIANPDWINTGEAEGKNIAHHYELSSVYAVMTKLCTHYFDTLIYIGYRKSCFFC